MDFRDFLDVVKLCFSIGAVANQRQELKQQTSSAFSQLARDEHAIKLKVLPSSETARKRNLFTRVFPPRIALPASHLQCTVMGCFDRRRLVIGETNPLVMVWWLLIFFFFFCSCDDP